ncbi:MAG: hypothetical protein QGI95_03350, partial [Dehalococcoidales bacterium]|nr:hypothetical protein [Dehalococcoidales bacterium]
PTTTYWNLGTPTLDKYTSLVVDYFPVVSGKVIIYPGKSSLLRFRMTSSNQLLEERRSPDEP